MITNIIFLNLIFGALLNPQIPVQDTYYPSGNKDADKIYSSDRPSKKYPLLKLGITAYDAEFNKIEPGIYSVEYSPEYNALLIGNGRNIVKSPVYQVIKLSKQEQSSKKNSNKKHKNSTQMNENYGFSSANIAFIKDKKVFIIYKKDNLEVQSFLYLPEAILDGD